MKKNSLPKFQIGQKVFMKKPNLYGELMGVIYSVEKTYKEIENGKFKAGGLVTGENLLPSLAVPYKLEGETLEIDQSSWNGGIQISKFYGYSYGIQSVKMKSIYPEKMIRKIETLSADEIKIFDAIETNEEVNFRLNRIRENLANQPK